MAIRGDDMILKAKVGLFVCGVVASAAIAVVEPSDQAALGAASTRVPYMPSDLANEEFQKGMTQARIAAVRPFAAFTANVR